MPVKARSFLGFDPVAKKVISLGVDNFGGALQLTGPIEGDKISTEGEGTNSGQKLGFKQVFTKTGDRSLTWHGELRMGKDWIVRPVMLAGNQDLILEEGVVITAKRGEYRARIGYQGLGQELRSCSAPFLILRTTKAGTFSLRLPRP